MKNEFKVIYEDFVKPTLKYTKQITKYSLIVTLSMAVLLLGVHISPSVVRMGLEEKDIKKKFDDRNGAIGAFLTLGAVYLIGSGYFLPKYFNEITGLYIVSNTISGSYELWRYAHKKAEKIYGNNNVNNENLETKINSIEIVPQNFIEEGTKENDITINNKSKIPNPWNVKIDEIEQIGFGNYGGLK